MNSYINTAENFVAIKDMSNVIDFTSINNEFDTLSFKPNKDNSISENMNFFDKDIFKEHKDILVQECKNYLNQFYNVGHLYEDLIMKESWGNLSKPTEKHHVHNHLFSVVSGVLYLDNNPSNLKLHVETNYADIPYFVPSIGTFASLYTIMGANQANFEEHNNLKNHLILFLSNKKHYVDIIPDDGLPRKSISFNTFWKGLVGIPGFDLGNHVF